jgi:nucleoprotein TPR
LIDQNNKLHTHLENVTAQAARIRSAAAVAEFVDTESTTTNSSDLQSIVTFLRKEKEIADLQLEINKQEIARHKADIERLSKEVDEQKALLTEVCVHLLFLPSQIIKLLVGASSSSQFAGLCRATKRSR